jgi:hypothetical protein
MLQKYIGVIGAAIFAAAGIEYFSAYMQAKKIFDATAPIRMTKTESTGAPPSAVIMETNASSNVSTNSALDQQVPESRTMNVSSETMQAGTGNSSPGVESSPTNEATALHAPATATISPSTTVPSPDATGSLNDSVSGPSSIPPESLTHVGGMHGLYDALSLHPGIWFLFGCIFVVFLLIVREIYYKKRTK